MPGFVELDGPLPEDRPESLKRSQRVTLSLGVPKRRIFRTQGRTLRDLRGAALMSVVLILLLSVVGLAGAGLFFLLSSRKGDGD